MNTYICDVCLATEGKIVQTNHYLTVPNMEELDIDVCDKHYEQIISNFPKATSGYRSYVKRILDEADNFMEGVSDRIDDLCIVISRGVRIVEGAVNEKETT